MVREGRIFGAHWLSHEWVDTSVHVSYSYFASLSLSCIFLFLLQDCWTHVNAKKGFLPKLWALLKEGGKGMAKALHPNLMPLLSKLPREVTEPALDFFTTFFTSFTQGWVVFLCLCVSKHELGCNKNKSLDDNKRSLHQLLPWAFTVGFGLEQHDPAPSSVSQCCKVWWGKYVVRIQNFVWGKMHIVVRDKGVRDDHWMEKG